MLAKVYKKGIVYFVEHKGVKGFCSALDAADFLRRVIWLFDMVI